MSCNGHAKPQQPTNVMAEIQHIGLQSSMMFLPNMAVDCFDKYARMQGCPKKTTEHKQENMDDYLKILVHITKTIQNMLYACIYTLSVVKILPAGSVEVPMAAKDMLKQFLAPN